MTNPLADAFRDQWEVMVAWINGELEKLTDDDLTRPIGPGKNHGVWLLGHLVESEDELSKYLGVGPMLFPEYEATFGQGSPLKAPSDYPSVKELREQWNRVVEKNRSMLATINDSMWKEPRALLEGPIEDDFFRTKGRAFAIWNIHEMYHCGQLSALTQKKG